MAEFLSWPLWGRTALALGLAPLVLLPVRVPLLKFLSMVPFLLKRAFRMGYLLLEWLVALLHKSLGGMFYRVANGLAATGKGVDEWLERWYERWNKSRSGSSYAASVAVVLVVCYLYIVVPSTLHMEEGYWLTRGWSAYLRAEDTFAGWMEDQGWYDPDGHPDAEEVSGEPEPIREVVQIPLTVSRVSSVLSIRDIPSTLGNTLDTLPNGAVVTWNGELTFGPAEGRQEPWVKVTSDSGAEGWSRLNFLHLEEDAEPVLLFTSLPKADLPAPPAE